MTTSRYTVHTWCTSFREVFFMHTIITGEDNPTLRQKSTPVPAVTKDISKLITEMRSIMHLHKGVGLAAPQIGILKRIIVLELDPKHAKRKEDGFPFLALVNPVIFWRSQETNTYEEGCLSLPNCYGSVTRPSEVKLRALDEKGKNVLIHAKGFKACVIQHEVDHLDGVLFVDYGK